MNLLTTTVNDGDITPKILHVLGQLGICGEEEDIAREFFDFSKEADLSLLTRLKLKNLNYDSAHNDSNMLFDEIKYLPIKITMEVSDRFILFLDALCGNTIGRFLFRMYDEYENPGLRNRLCHAYERKYTAEELQPKMLAFLAFGMSIGKNLYTNSIILAAAKNPRDAYIAGKNYCIKDNSLARERLYALALAYRKDGMFSAEELEEMEGCLLQTEKGMPSHYTADQENMVLLLYMSMNYGDELRHRFKLRMKMNYYTLLSAILQFVPNNYFKNNMEIVAEVGETALNSSVDKMIKRTVQSAVIVDAFKMPESGYQAKNSLCFLEMLAKKYTEQFISCMPSNEPLGVGAKWGYMFDCYQYLYKILERAVPDVKEKYDFDTENIMIDNVIHREVTDVKNTIRREVMDYLKGNADVSVLESVRDELYEDYKEWSYEQHEINLLSQLSGFGEFYNRYLALKIIQNPRCIAKYIRAAFQGNENELAKTTMINVFRGVIREHISPEDRIGLFELIYSQNLDFEERKTVIADALVAIMEENSKESDKYYEKICPEQDVFFRCCYTRYLEKTNTDGRNKERLIAMCGDSSKEVRRTITEIIGQHREYENEILSMLSSKKQFVRDTAIEILSSWGADNYRDAFAKALETEKSAKITDKLIRILNVSDSEETVQNEISAEQLVENLHKGGKNKKLLWLYENTNPVVHFKSGEVAEDKYMQAIILCYANMQTVGRNDYAIMLADKLNEDELSKFAMEIFSKWLSDGAESKKKWALYFSVIHGGDVMVETALSYIKEWAENMRGAIAAEAVKAIALNGSSLALMTVDNLAHKFKQKQVKKAAVEAMDTAAEALGITADELGDKIVPDLGFDENMLRIFDYGTRKFKVFINPALELEVYDETNKKLKTMPSPGKKDDEETAKVANTEFKQMKKQLKNVIAIQKMRLETALLADRRWSKDNWEKLFVKNPVMHSFAIGLIWAAYDGDNMVQTFRYMEDGTFNTVDEEEYELADNVKIGLVHPIDLDEDTLSAWKEQLSDYEISQPIEQLERMVYRINNEEIGKLDLNRFSGRELNGMSLLGRTSKFGWSKGSIQDAGGFYVFYREDVTERIKNSDGTVSLKGNAVELHFSGMYVGGEDENVTIENVRFYTPGTVQHGSYVYDEADDNKAIMLDKVNPRYFSEILNQLEEITRQAESSVKE